MKHNQRAEKLRRAISLGRPRTDSSLQMMSVARRFARADRQLRPIHCDFARKLDRTDRTDPRMNRHEPGEDGRCRASDLLPSDCAGCRGSDTSFVDKLLADEPEPQADYAVPAEEPDPSGPVYANRSGPRRGKWWLDTGPAHELVADSHPFKSSYRGSQCKARCGEEIKTGQLIVHLTIGGYAHVACLKGDR